MAKQIATTSADRIRHVLQEEISSAKLAPGSPLDELELAARHGVSRTPVRDALLQLSAQGFVRIVPRVGIFVADLSPDELGNMFETLAYLEGMCAGLAAQRMDDDGRRKLAHAHAAARAAAIAQQPGGYAQVNHRFHSLLYSHCGNDYLILQIMAIRARTQPYTLRQFDQPDRPAHSWREHGDILMAVADRDERAATQAATRHIVLGGQEFREFARRFPEKLYPPVGELRYAGPGPLDWLYGARCSPAQTSTN